MGCSPWSHKESDMTEQLTLKTLKEGKQCQAARAEEKHLAGWK